MLAEIPGTLYKSLLTKQQRKVFKGFFIGMAGQKIQWFSDG